MGINRNIDQLNAVLEKLNSKEKKSNNTRFHVKRKGAYNSFTDRQPLKVAFVNKNEIFLE